MTHSTKKDLAYVHIRRQILEKRLLPGQRITASHVAAEIGTSVLPVREALLSLEAERLVTLTPYVGAVVAWVSTDAIFDVIRVLAVLEGYATAEAFERAPSDLEPLAQLNDDLRRAARDEAWGRFLELNRAFHFRIFEASGNAQLIDSLRIYWSQLDAMLVATSFHALPRRTSDDIEEHDHLIRMISERGTNRIEVELAARRHRMRTAHLYEERLATGT